MMRQLGLFVLIALMTIRLKAEYTPRPEDTNSDNARSCSLRRSNSDSIITPRAVSLVQDSSSGSKVYAKVPTLDGYTPTAQLDSLGGELSHPRGQTIAQLKALCDSNPQCLGFNTDGSVKKSLLPKSSWSAWGSTIADVTYLKNGYTPSKTPQNYTFYSGKDSAGGESTNLPDRTLDEVRAFCDDNPSCLGYNTGGWIKTSLKTDSKFTAYGNGPNDGLYVKQRSNLIFVQQQQQPDPTTDNIDQLSDEIPIQLEASIIHSYDTASAYQLLEQSPQIPTKKLKRQDHQLMSSSRA